jgi:hypothetical protein
MPQLSLFAADAPGNTLVPRPLRRFSVNGVSYDWRSDQPLTSDGVLAAAGLTRDVATLLLVAGQQVTNLDTIDGGATLPAPNGTAFRTRRRPRPLHSAEQRPLW